jgi:hypothetical protein
MFSVGRGTGSRARATFTRVNSKRWGWRWRSKGGSAKSLAETALRIASVWGERIRGEMGAEREGDAIRLRRNELIFVEYHLIVLSI